MMPRRTRIAIFRFPPKVLAVLEAYGIDLADPATAAAFRDGVRAADEAARAYGYFAQRTERSSCTRTAVPEVERAAELGSEARRGARVPRCRSRRGMQDATDELGHLVSRDDFEVGVGSETALLGGLAHDRSLPGRTRGGKAWRAEQGVYLAILAACLGLRCEPRSADPQARGHGLARLLPLRSDVDLRSFGREWGITFSSSLMLPGGA